MSVSPSLPRILFVYAYPFDAAALNGSVPRERHGFFALRDRGVDVTAVDNRLPRGRTRYVVGQAVQRAYVIPRTGLGYRLDQAAAVRRHVASDPERWVLAETDSLALPLLSLKVRRRLSNPVAYISVGLGDRLVAGRIAPRLARRYVRLVEAADVVLVYTPRESEVLTASAPSAAVHVIPLGVDVDWWTPPPGHDVEAATVFSAGRDPSRSFATLAEAVRSLPVRTTIVGNLAREQGIVPGERLAVHDDLPVAELRALLWRSQVVAVPSQPAAHGSGQTAALHAMAAGKPVVMTDTGWARRSGLVAGEHFVDVPPADPAALRVAIAGLIDDAERASRIGGSARDTVQARFSAEHEGAAILAALGGT
jgi:glycosyltransferase involved in cell wall biosynthesis